MTLRCSAFARSDGAPGRQVEADWIVPQALPGLPKPWDRWAGRKAGSSLRTHAGYEGVCCTGEPLHVGTFNAVYDRHFAADNPARIFVAVPSWPGPFDVEVDCVAVVG